MPDNKALRATWQSKDHFQHWNKQNAIRKGIPWVNKPYDNDTKVVQDEMETNLEEATSLEVQNCGRSIPCSRPNTTKTSPTSLS
mmetsp:Transcript_22114/g.46045  ORF Transcript_22114/g.46045 Transcript_22114/m.46045 type:complete len:84 (+) Transcript_22114:486-737(+)